MLRVHRRGEGQLPRAQHVRVGRSVDVGVLRVARPVGLGHRPPPRRSRGADPGDLRRLRWHLRPPTHPCRAGPLRCGRQPRAGPPADARAGPAALPAGPWRPTTTVAGATPAPDLVGRDFTAAAPGVKLVGDITYLPTWAGWLYLATVIDCHTKACIGYAMADHLRTELVIDALTMAARNYSLADGAIFHSDRGTQYTSEAFATAAGQLGIRRSVGRTGSCFDNALAESFNAAIKVERVNRTVYPTREHARADVTRYIEFRYNRRRLHSALGYRTPQEVHDEYLNSQLAA